MKRLHLVEMYADGTGLAHSAGCEEDGVDDAYIREAMERQPDGSPGYWIWATAKFDAESAPSPGNLIDWSDLE